MRKRAYYAHCLAIYNTPQENRDLVTIDALGFDVLNPNAAHISASVAEMKRHGNEQYMEYFKGLISTCDVLIFRALPGWGAMIPAGVAKEIVYAQELSLPVLELPTGAEHRTMSLIATREYLRECGQR